MGYGYGAELKTTEAQLDFRRNKTNHQVALHFFSQCSKKVHYLKKEKYIILTAEYLIKITSLTPTSQDFDQYIRF